ncbi:MAG: VWA domain-containing protein [Planctomycetota bacterium]
MLLLQPWFLLLLPVVAWPWIGKGAARDRGQALLRGVVLALVVLSLARPVSLVEDAAPEVVMLLDQSASLASGEADRGEEAATNLRESLPADAAVQTIRFGDGSSLGGALDAAVRALPPTGPSAVVLASDGAATALDWGRALANLRAQGIPVSVLPLADEADELRVVGLRAEGLLREGHPARLIATVAGRHERARLSLHREGEEGAALAVSPWFAVDGRREVALAFEAEQAGFVRLVAMVEGDGEGVDLRAADNRLARTVAVQDPLQVLHLAGRMQDGDGQLAKLLGPGFDLTQPASLDQVNLGTQSLVWLDDLEAEAVPASFQEQLRAAVQQQGVGMVMSGSAAFGPGGWSETPIEEMLPVSFVQKEEKRDPSTTLCVIIDTSGSMGGNRVQLAKEVARLAINRLLPHDKVGIVEFYGAKRWAAPIQPASNRIELERALNRLDAGGGTVILPAIEEAWYGMKNVNTRYKHVLVLTDGGVETGPFESVLRRMADDGMNVSTVLIGPETHSEFLVNLANWGKGRFYNVPNRFNLPEVILKQPATARLPAYRPGPHRVQGRGGLAWWATTDLEDLPPLDGYVETEARPGAEVMMSTVAGAHPLLASWRDGLGRVTAMTMSPVGPDTRGWQDWEPFGTMMAQALTRTAGEAEPFRYTLTRDGREVLLTAERNRPHALLPQAVVLDRDGDLAFLEVAADRFEARFTVDPANPVRVLAGRTRLVADPPAAPELQVDPRAALPLAGLAALTGGRELDGVDFTGLPLRSGAGLLLRERAPWTLALALVLLLAELAWRRRPQGTGGAA